MSARVPPPLSKKDKTIRLLASAAISGLTISFLLSESIDARLGNERAIFSTSSSKRISLPVVKPLVSLKNILIHSSPQAVQSDLQSISSIPPPPPPAVVTVDFVESVMSAKVEPAPQPDLTPKEKPKEEKKEEVFFGAKQLNSPPPVKFPNAAIENKASEDKYKISGVITGAEKDIKGYFEVGLYKKIDVLGLPVGYPLVQQILPKHERAFALENMSTDGEAYLFARYVSAKESSFYSYRKNPIRFSNPEQPTSNLEIPYKKDELIGKLDAKDKVTNVHASTMKERTALRGRVGAMFGPKGSFLPVSGVRIGMRGSTVQTKSTAEGEFRLNLEGLSGDVLLEFLKPGYVPIIHKLSLKKYADKDLFVEMVSGSAIDQMAHSLGIRQSAAKSIFIGYVRGREAKALSGITAQISLNADGPYYFNEAGFPEAPSIGSTRGTSSDGRFIFFNVEAGGGLLEASLNGESISPIIINAVEGGGLIYKELEPVEARVRGRLYSPILQADGAKKSPAVISGARVKIEGSSEWTSTDAFGSFELPNLRFFKEEEIPLEITSEKYFTHYYHIVPRAGTIDLFAFSAQYISALAASVDVGLDPQSSIIIGSVGSGRSLRMDALSDHGHLNRAKDYYFGSGQVIKGSYAHTDKQYGTYIIFNVPKGRTILQGLDTAGKMRISRILNTNPSTVSVVIHE